MRNRVGGLTRTIVDIQAGAAGVEEELHGVTVKSTISSNDLADEVHVHCSDIAEGFNIVDIFGNKLPLKLASVHSQRYTIPGTEEVHIDAKLPQALRTTI